MKTIQAIIQVFGGLAALAKSPIKLEVEGYMPLCIELIGKGPRGLPLVSVMHYYLQAGDVMRDPDMEFEIDSDENWHPISYRQDSLNLMQEAVLLDGDTKRVLMRPKLAAELTRFSRSWSRNLKEQGFLEAAQHLAKGS